MDTATHTRKHSKSGFTIVEIIVIVTVIGILTTIGVVSYGGYRTRAAKSQAESTVQQVRLKLGEYYTDNNKYPLAAANVNTEIRTLGINTATADSFQAMIAAGATYVPLSDSGGTCNNVATPCVKYTITVPSSYWGGTDAALVITQ